MKNLHEMKLGKCIAYLAPEIPALSATFVYNEILALEKRGFEVVPISVHVPKTRAQEDDVALLAKKTRYLYREPGLTFLSANLKTFFTRPVRYLRTLLTVVSDALKMGVTGHIGRGLLYRFFVASRVADILKKNGCRHLHTHFAHVSTDIAMYASMLSGVPFSFTSHANDLFERGWLLREKVARAGAAITISEYNRRFFVRQGVDVSKIGIVRCGVESGEYQTADRKRSSNGVPVIGTLGRLVEKKGVDTLILALSRVSKQGFDFKLEIAGDGPLMDELRNLASEHDLNPKITFRGAMPHDEVFHWLKTLDIFVLACKKDKNGDQDGIPVVLMEAMATGIPVISTYISGIPELIEDGVSGMLARPGDPTSLSEKIESLLKDPSLPSSMAQSAIRRIREEFDTDVNIERLVRLFEGKQHG